MDNTVKWRVLHAYAQTPDTTGQIDCLTAYREDDPMRMIYLFTPVGKTASGVLYESDLKHSHEAPFYTKDTSFIWEGSNFIVPVGTHGPA